MVLEIMFLVLLDEIAKDEIILMMDGLRMKGVVGRWRKTDGWWAKDVMEGTCK